MVRESAIEFERTSHARAAVSAEKRCGDCRKCVSRLQGGGVNCAVTSYSVRYVVLRVDLGGAAVCSFSSRSQQFHASRVHDTVPDARVEGLLEHRDGRARRRKIRRDAAVGLQPRSLAANVVARRLRLWTRLDALIIRTSPRQP